MTTLVLAFQNQIGRAVSEAGTANHFGIFYQKRVSYFLASVLAVTAAVYLLGVYVSFRLGLELDRAVSMREELQENVLRQELLLQKRIDLLALEGQSIVEKMERVSGIKYLEQTGVVSSRSYILP